VTEPTPLEPTDPVLVRRFQQGQEQAFAVLMERHERRVYNLAYRMLGSPEDARDATQDAFLSCFRHLAKFRGDSSFSTWLHRIALNACYDALRRRRDTTSLEGRSVDPMPVADHADRAAAATDVQRALLGIPPDFRAVLVMHELQDLPLEDIAATLGLPVGTVKSRLHRGRVALGRILSGGRVDGTPNPGAPVQATKPMKTRPHLNS
jgi:RNA polymerase sigma-70 factor (ECF subfamily)